MKTYQMFIGGQWTDAVSGETFDDLNPYSGELYAKVAKGDAQDADRAMAAAFEAGDAAGWGWGIGMPSNLTLISVPTGRSLPVSCW